MPRNSPARLKIWGALLLSASLVSCNSYPAAQQASGTSGDPPLISSPDRLPAATSSKQPHIQVHQQRPSATPKPSESLPDKQPDASPPSVEASTVKPKPTEPAASPDRSFEPKSPSLAGIKLGAADKEVVKHYGLPADTYVLPGDKQTVEIWEYDGFSIGLSDKNKVVYVEIVSSDVDTGIHGLSNGMDGSRAAELLGIPSDDQANVMALEVSGGWFKLDLDPDTQKVLSLKLLSREI